MTLAVWYWCVLVLLNLVYVAFALRTLSDVIPGGLGGAAGRKRDVARGRLLAGPAGSVRGPLTEAPCLAWSVHSIARQGVSVVERREINSVANVGLETGSSSLELSLRGSASEPVADADAAASWRLTPSDFATCTRMRVSGEVLVSPSSSETGRGRHSQIERNATDWLREHSSAAERVVDRSTPIEYSLTEFRLLEGEEYVCEVQGSVDRADTQSPIKLAPANRLAAAVWRTVGRSVALLVALDVVFVLVFAAAWLASRD